jgi:hypothetical protein
MYENMVKCNKIVESYPKIVDCTERLSHAKIVECIGRLSHEKIVECIGRLSHGKIVDCIGRLSLGKIVECVRGGSNVWEDCGAYGCSVSCMGRSANVRETGRECARETAQGVRQPRYLGKSANQGSKKLGGKLGVDLLS